MISCSFSGNQLIQIDCLAPMRGQIVTIVKDSSAKPSEISVNEIGFVLNGDFLTERKRETNTHTHRKSLALTHITSHTQTHTHRKSLARTPTHPHRRAPKHPHRHIHPPKQTQTHPHPYTPTHETHTHNFKGHSHTHTHIYPTYTELYRM